MTSPLLNCNATVFPVLDAIHDASGPGHPAHVAPRNARESLNWRWTVALIGVGGFSLIELRAHTVHASTVPFIERSFRLTP